jgi:2-polyprenyl-6-methoxyphenol hydroxylase-like FAD-dependent oxidoreductase
MKEDPSVVIIGAGPTGLMMACQLAMRNISFRIIDKTDNHTTQSRLNIMKLKTYLQQFLKC